MKIINIHEAKTHLSRLVELAANGESFIIAKAGKPMVKVMGLAAPGAGQIRRLGFLSCVFRAKLDTHSTANWTPGPAQTGHAFHGKLDTWSSANWTPIPLQTGQFEAA